MRVSYCQMKIVHLTKNLILMLSDKSVRGLKHRTGHYACLWVLALFLMISNVSCVHAQSDEQELPKMSEEEMLEKLVGVYYQLTGLENEPSYQEFTEDGKRILYDADGNVRREYTYRLVERCEYGEQDHQYLEVSEHSSLLILEFVVPSGSVHCSIFPNFSEDAMTIRNLSGAGRQYDYLQVDEVGDPRPEPEERDDG